MITDLNFNLYINIQASFKSGELVLSLVNPALGHNLTSLDIYGYTDVPEMMNLFLRFYTGEELATRNSQITVYLDEHEDSESERDSKRIEIAFALPEFMQKNIIGLDVCDGLGNHSKIVGISQSPRYSYYSYLCNGGFVFNTGVIIQGSDIMDHDFEPFDKLKSIGSMSYVITNNDSDGERIYKFKRSQFFHYLSHMYMYHAYESNRMYTFVPKRDSRFLNAEVFYDIAKGILSLNRRHRAELNRYYHAIKNMQDNTWRNTDTSSYYDDFNVEYGHIARSSYKKVAQLIADFANKNPQNFIRLYNGESSFRGFFYGREQIICHIREYSKEKPSLNLIA